MPARKRNSQRTKEKRSKTLNDYFGIERTIKKRETGTLTEDKLRDIGHQLVPCFDNARDQQSSTVSENRGAGVVAKPDRKARWKTLKDFYPVRRSNRKPESEIKKEKLQEIEETVLSDEERGLRICNFVGKGRGVVADQFFRRGDFVVEYRGDLIDMAEAKRRESVYEQDSSVGCYMYYFQHKDQPYCVDATAESGYYGRLVNHSVKDPNLITRVVEVKNAPHLILVAARDISVGEELLYDYGDRNRRTIEANPWLKTT